MDLWIHNSWTFQNGHIGIPEIFWLCVILLWLHFTFTMRIQKTLTCDEFHLVPLFGFHYHLILTSDLMAEPHFIWKMLWACSVNTQNKPEKCDPMWSVWCKTKKENTKLWKITCRLQIYAFIVSSEVRSSTTKTTNLYMHIHIHTIILYTQIWDSGKQRWSTCVC